MGNKSSAELWNDVYKLQEKEMLDFSDQVTEKVQMGELDMTDSKAMEQFAQDFSDAIAADKKKLIEGLWLTYAPKKGTGVVGRSECRNIIKDALKEGKNHLPRILVSYTETAAMRKHSLKATKLMQDSEARPLLEASLARIRKDVGDRVRGDLDELLSDANSLADILLIKLTSASEPEAKAPAPSAVLDSDDEGEARPAAPEVKVDPKATVNKDLFQQRFFRAHHEAMNVPNLVESAKAQFTSFLEMELRQIPHRVIEKLEQEEEAAEKAAGGGDAGAGAVDADASDAGPASEAGDDDDED